MNRYKLHHEEIEALNKQQVDFKLAKNPDHR